MLATRALFCFGQRKFTPWKSRDLASEIVCRRGNIAEGEHFYCRSEHRCELSEKLGIHMHGRTENLRLVRVGEFRAPSSVQPIAMKIDKRH